MESLQEDLHKELRMTSDFQANQNDFNFVRDIVNKLFKRKVAPITLFLRLLKTTQRKHQSVKEFARNIE